MMAFASRPASLGKNALVPLLCVSLLLVGFLPPAAASGSVDPALPEGLLSSLQGRSDAWVRSENGAVEASSPGPRDLFEGLLDENGLTDGRLLAERARQAVAEANGIPAAPMFPRAAEVATPASHLSGVVRYGLPAGDLDGDGLADVLSYELNYSSFTFGIRALDATGAELWARAYGGDTYDAFAMPAGDLDGDGADEVLLFSLRIPSWTGAVVVGVLDLVWTYEVMGASDAVVWARTVHGSVTDLGAAVVAENLLVVPQIGGDHDGDGGRDVVINEFDVHGADGGAGLIVGAGATVLAFETDWAALSGADGTPILGGTLGPGTYIPYALAANDLSGDGVPDLFTVEPSFVAAIGCVLLCAGAESAPLLTASALSGADGTELWTVDDLEPAAEFRFGLNLGDLSGDGADELILASFLVTGALCLEALDGTTGTSSWQDCRAEPVLNVLPLGDANGDGAGDLLVLGRFYSFGPQIGFRGISGADGSTIYVERHAPPCADYCSVFMLVDGDHDADGTVDGLVSSVSWDFDSDTVTLGSMAVAGGTGGVLWQAAGIALPGGAMDGAPGDDAVLLDLAVGTSGVQWTVTGASGLDASALWGRSELLVLQSDMWLEAADGTLDGHPSGDLLWSALTVGEAGDIASQVRGTRGHDGATLWAVGEPLHAGEPGEPGEDPPATVNFYTVESIPAEPANASGWTPLNLFDDSVTSIPTAPFPFFDEVGITNLSVSSNGFVAPAPYNGDPGCCSGGSIPSDDRVNGIIAGLWTDLNPNNCGEVRFDATAAGVRVAFLEVPYFGQTCVPGLPVPYDGVTFWIGIEAGTGTVEVHLLGADGGSTATTGIESPLGDVGNETRRTHAPLASPVAWRFTLVEGVAPPGNDPPTASFTGTVSGATLDVDASASSDPDGDPLTYTWDFGDGNVGTGVTASHTYAGSGTYAVTLTVADGNGGSATAAQTFDIFVPVPPRVESTQFAGFIACSVAYPPVQTRDLCADHDPNAVQSFDLAFDPGLSGLHVEITWTPSGDFGAEEMGFTWIRPAGLQRAEGTSPVVHDQTVDPSKAWTATGTQARIEVRPSGQSGLVMQQPFDLCVVTLYGGAALPADACA